MPEENEQNTTNTVEPEPTPIPVPTTEPEEEDALVATARGWLRIATTSRDDEIRQVIDACLIDLSNGGVKKIDEDDAMIRQAIKLYLKSQFGYDAQAEKFAKAYEYLKYSLELSSDYNTEES